MGAEPALESCRFGGGKGKWLTALTPPPTPPSPTFTLVPCLYYGYKCSRLLDLYSTDSRSQAGLLARLDIKRLTEVQWFGYTGGPQLFLAVGVTFFPFRSSQRPWDSFCLLPSFKVLRANGQWKMSSRKGRFHVIFYVFVFRFWCWKSIFELVSKISLWFRIRIFYYKMLIWSYRIHLAFCGKYGSLRPFMLLCGFPLLRYLSIPIVQFVPQVFTTE